MDNDLLFGKEKYTTDMYQWYVVLYVCQIFTKLKLRIILQRLSRISYKTSCEEHTDITVTIGSLHRVTRIRSSEKTRPGQTEVVAWCDVVSLSNGRGLCVSALSDDPVTGDPLTGDTDVTSGMTSIDLLTSKSRTSTSSLASPSAASQSFSVSGLGRECIRRLNNTHQH